MLLHNPKAFCSRLKSQPLVIFLLYLVLLTVCDSVSIYCDGCDDNWDVCDSVIVMDVMIKGMYVTV